MSAETVDLLFMNWWIKDFLADTVDLDAEESGAYMMLIGQCYLDGFLPTDRKKLLRISRLFDKEKLPVLEGLIASYFKETDEGLVNPRAIREREAAIRRVEAARENGKLGGRPAKAKRQAPPPRPPAPSLAEPGTGAGIVEQARAAWNAAGLAPCRRLPTDMKDQAGIAGTVRTFSAEEILGAVEWFAKLRGQAVESGEKVPQTFESFFVGSIDRWTDEARPWERYEPSGSSVDREILEGLG